GDGVGRIEVCADCGASAPHGAGAHPDHEPTASRSAQRRPALQEAVVARIGTGATGGIPVSPVGEPAPEGSAGVARSTDSYDCRADPSHRAGSGKVSGGAAIANPSRGRSTDGTGLPSDHRESKIG